MFASLNWRWAEDILPISSIYWQLIKTRREGYYVTLYRKIANGNQLYKNYKNSMRIVIGSRRRNRRSIWSTEEGAIDTNFKLNYMQLQATGGNGAIKGSFYTHTYRDKWSCVVDYILTQKTFRNECNWLILQHIIIIRRRSWGDGNQITIMQINVIITLLANIYIHIVKTYKKYMTLIITADTLEGW